MESIAEVIADQKKLFAFIKRTQANLNNRPREDITRGYTQTILEELELALKTFKDGHDQLVHTIRENSIAEKDVPYLKEEIYEAGYEIYISLKSTLLDIMYAFDSPTTPTVHASTFASPSNGNETFCAGARLPKIDLPKFSGDYLEWISYRDMFLSLVHHNNSLTNIQKYFYLKRSCIGTPLNLVSEFPAADSSYKLAWEALERRFHNERRLVEQIFNKLFAIPSSNGSFESIKELLDSSRNCFSQLKALKIDISTWDPILIYIITQKFDSQTRKEWEQSLKEGTTTPPITDILSFLETLFRALESANELRKSLPTKSFTKPSDSRRKPMRTIRTHTATALSNDSCPCCSKRHPLYKCFKFPTLSSEQKKMVINHQQLCRNCLRTGHMQPACKLNTRCQLCGEPHHTIIHNEFSRDSKPGQSLSNFNLKVNTETTSTPMANSVSTNLTNMKTFTVNPALLPTIKLKIKTMNGFIHAKALLDQGSQVSFISEQLCQLLSLPTNRTNYEVSGIGNKKVISIRKSINFNVKSNYDQNFLLNLTALVIPSVTSYIPYKLYKVDLPNLSEFQLADPQFLMPEKIDILLGNDVYGELLQPGLKKFKNSFFLQETYFGWIVSGPVSKSNATISANLCTLDKQLRLFWEQEELPDVRNTTNDEQLCENLFLETHSRDQSGRYTVNLPFKKVLHGQSLPSFYFTDYNALKRYKQLESTFAAKPQFAEQYKKFMVEYESLQHMIKLGEYPQAVPKNSYFLPHHGVLREGSSTTKLRVVFDGSNRKPPFPSLNEELAAGPALQNDLPSIILRWRKHRVAFTADLEKMFRQIKVCPEHQNFQSILWRDNNNKLCVYSLQTVTYGTTSAPYLAIRVLHQLATDEEKRYPLACNILRSDTYVDDIISGADTFEEALQLQRQLCTLLKSGGFRLRKWNSNSTELLESIPEDEREIKDLFSIQQTNSIKALGLYWNTTRDYFFFLINFEFSNTVTKRSLLSDAAKLFDPLGWLAPTTIIAKIKFQELWKIKIDWNDSLPEDMSRKWINFRSKLKHLVNIKIPRWLNYSVSSTLELHGFSDASKSAYAAAVYARMISEDGEVVVNLLQAKTKVAPLKIETIPRLELCAATLLAKLVASIKTTTEFEIHNIVYWTDSTIVLAWLKNHSSRLEVYVANRVTTIQRLSDANNWRYVPSGQNPADCASRGLQPEELLHHKIWFKGPPWLNTGPETWPENPACLANSYLTADRCAVTTNNTTIQEYPPITTRFSKWITLIRVTTYIFRFFNNLKLSLQKKEKQYGFLTTHELEGSKLLLIKLTQAVSFSEDIYCLKSNKPLPANSTIGKLSPFIDEQGILRVGGRISNADIPFQIKHPILLSKKNPLSSLLFSEAHKKTLHGSLQLMQSYISRYYWILSARQLAKSVQRKCIVCFKYKTQTCQQLMGNLPAVRVQPTRPFKHSGLDYAGPISIKMSSLRNAPSSKAYICLFICMCTKAIHLEAVTSLTVDGFFAAFRRFTARRGLCTDLYSDCGTNFVGANKELQVIYQRNKLSLPEHLQETLANQGTKWHFIPPASPHFGGLWEAGVKSTKHHLRRIMKDRLLTYEELSTLLAQIESCLNSRPLCPMSADPADNDALTPAHFLIGEPTNCIPADDTLDISTDRLTRWKLVENLKQHFWSRWHNEFMSRLQSRPKWNQIKQNLQVGDIVLLLHEKSVPGQWPLAKVEKLHPGNDGLVRVVTLYCNNKYVKRPISKICLLPASNHQYQ